MGGGENRMHSPTMHRLTIREFAATLSAIDVIPESPSPFPGKRRRRKRRRRKKKRVSRFIDSFDIHKTLKANPRRICHLKETR
jgi:aminoglycoside phosphotransferase (APT) family kinase protein